MMEVHSGYATGNRKRILDFLKENCSHTVTVTDIQQFLRESDSAVNITTIYRYLDKLVSEGIVMKFVDRKSTKAVFQYMEPGHKCEEHLHLQCVKCGKVIHLECAFMGEIYQHILQEHDFAIQCKDSLIYGMCSQCRKQSQEVEKNNY